MDKLLFGLSVTSIFVYINSQSFSQSIHNPIKTRKVATVTLNDSLVKGIITFTQERPESDIIISGTIFELPKGSYSLAIHKNGDISKKCMNIGPVLDIKQLTYSRSNKLFGELGNIISDSSNTSRFNIKNNLIALNGIDKILNRALAVHVLSSKSLTISKAPILLCGKIIPF